MDGPGPAEGKKLKIMKRTKITQHIDGPVSHGFEMIMNIYLRSLNERAGLGRLCNKVFFFFAATTEKNIL